ncbi:MAG: hypothetical protein JNN05_04875 [Candidatus Omnitrophica bacterium]|nr:hypothetical protein [Candidatus Omnitrophota bacterium]
MAQHQAVPSTDPFPAVGEEQKPWIFTQWLGSSVIYGAYSAGGFEGLKWLRLVVFILVIGIFYAYARNALPFEILFSLLLILDFGLIGRVLLRPDIFNYIFIEIFLLFLFAHYENGQRKHLLAIALLGIVWGNIHLGSLVYGYFLIVLFVIAAVVEWISVSFKNESAEKIVAVRRRALELVSLSFVYPVTFFFSPYGVQGGLYPFKVFLVPDFIYFYQFVHLMQEMLPPSYLFSWNGMWFIVLVITAIGMLLSNPKDKFLHWILFVVPLFMFLRGGRAAGLFVVMTAFVIVGCARNLNFLKAWQAYKYRAMVSTSIMVVLGLLLSTQLIYGFSERIYAQDRMRPMYTVTTDPRLPFLALEFLKKNQISGVVFTNDNLGGFLLWTSYPALRPFVDGRQLHPDQFFQYTDVLRNPPENWDSLASRYDLSIVLLDLSSGVSMRLGQYLSNHPGWQLVYLQGVTVVFFKREAFSLNSDIDSFSDRLGRERVSSHDMALLNQVALSQRSARRVEGSALKYNEFLYEGYVLLALNYKAAAVSRLVKAYEVSDDAAVRSLMLNAYRMLPKNGL